MSVLSTIYSINPFLFMALGAGLAASVSGGIIGAYVVTKRIVFIGGSISHAVLGGMGLFLWLKRTYHIPFLSPLHGALLAAILSAFILGWVHLKCKEREDSIIAAIWATGTSIGVLFITFTPGYNVELMNFLFGNILWATQSDLSALLILDAVVVGSTLLFYKKFQAICFDEKQAKLQGLPVHALYVFLLCLISLSIVILIQVVGAILVISLLTLPAATTAGMAKKLSTLMKTSIIASMIFTCVGIYLSYQLDWPPGATITLVAAACYSIYLASSRKLILRK